MRALAAGVLLDAWERGRARPPLERALTLLGAAFPEETRDALARLPVGRRNARLLALREQLFGRRLESVARCPACGALLELDLDMEDLRAAPAPVDAPPATLTVTCGELTVRFRLPDTLDLEAAGSEHDPAAARTRLVERCVLAAQRRTGGEDAPGVAVPSAAIPPEVWQEVAAQMAAADPQAAIELEVACPGCSHAWEAAFDVGAYLAAEIAVWAERLLDDVHLLASAYGWRESEILALSPWRRRLYLDRVRG
jgi:hypothetical protein